MEYRAWSFPLVATCSRGGRTRDWPRRGSDRPGNPLGFAYLPHPDCKRPPLNWLCTLGCCPRRSGPQGLLRGQNDIKLEGVTTFPVSPSPPLQPCRGVEDSGRRARGKCPSGSLGENQVRGERSERGEEKEAVLSASSRDVRAVVRAKVSGSQTGAAEITVVSLPRCRLPAAAAFPPLHSHPAGGPPDPRKGRSRYSQVLLPRLSGLPLEHRPRDGGLSELAETKLELGGLAALGEGTWRAGAGMGGAAFCPFLSQRRGG